MGNRGAAAAAHPPAPPNVKYRGAGRGASIGGMPIGHRRRAWHGATLALVVCAAAAAGVAWASAAASPRLLSDADNGQTVTVSVGTTLRLVLHSTYWRMGGSSARSVVAASGSPRYASRPGGVAGSGNGTVTETFRALRRGRARLSASRFSCGEALRCTPSQGSFSVVVVVSAHPHHSPGSS
jgi:hypothetical protein